MPRGPRFAPPHHDPTHALATTPPPRTPLRTLLASALLALSLSAFGQMEPNPEGASTGAPDDAPDDAPRAVAQLDAWPLWIEAGRAQSASVVSADGSVWWLSGADDGAPQRLFRNAAGEQLTACGPALLVVDDRGALRRLPRAPDLPVVSVSGPPVSRYHKPVCTSDGDVVALDPSGAVVLLGRELDERARASVAALPDAELILLDLAGVSAVAVLSEPTQRYRHGTLGDEVEAGGVTLLSLPELEVLARWQPPLPAVIEARRVEPWRWGDAFGIDLVVADDSVGARLVRLLWDGAALVPFAQGEALGASQRWLHPLGGRDEVVYALHEPREPGALMRYAFSVSPASLALGIGPSSAVRPTPLATGLASHVDGERLLDRAAVVGTFSDGADLLAVPSADQRALVWLRCSSVGCDELRRDALPSGLATNLAPSPAGGAIEALIAGERDGTIWRLPLPLAFTAPAAGDANESAHSARDTTTGPRER